MTNIGLPGNQDSLFQEEWEGAWTTEGLADGQADGKVAAPKARGPGLDLQNPFQNKQTKDRQTD